MTNNRAVNRERKRIFITLSADVRAELDRIAGSSRRRSKLLEAILREHFDRKASEAQNLRNVEVSSSTI